MDDAVRGQVARLLAEHPDGVLPIVQAGDPVLRQVAAPYTGQLGDLFGPFLTAMQRTMRAAPGVGLAAPQVGVGLAIAVIEDPGVPGGEHDPRERPPTTFRVLVNPAYVPVGSERVAFFEGCLSVPGWQAVRSRCRAVRLTGVDELGVPIDEVVSGWPARIVQHETDHLGGELYLDRAELRSLSSAANMARWWAAEATADTAAMTLGFSLP